MRKANAWEQRKLESLVIDHNAGIYISKEDYGSDTNVVGVGNIKKAMLEKMFL